MRIRTTILSGLTAGILLASGGAFAQSGQGGYLGINPHPVATDGFIKPPGKGSGEGGYLGLNPGATQTSSGAPLVREGSGQGGYLGKQPWQDPEQPPRD